MNFPLKAEDEQRSSSEANRAFLKASRPDPDPGPQQRLDLSQYVQNLEAATDPDDEASLEGTGQLACTVRPRTGRETDAPATSILYHHSC